MVWAEPNRNMNDPNAGFFEDLKQRLIHLIGWKLVVDIILKPDMRPPIAIGRAEQFACREEWVKLSVKEISERGYCKLEGWKDNLAWWGVPVYGQITNGKTPEPMNQETATTFNDRMKSKATQKFIRSLSRQALPSLSFQQIALIGVLGAGAILGMWWLGVF